MNALRKVRQPVERGVVERTRGSRNYAYGHPSNPVDMNGISRHIDRRGRGSREEARVRPVPARQISISLHAKHSAGSSPRQAATLLSSDEKAHFPGWSAFALKIFPYERLHGSCLLPLFQAPFYGRSLVCHQDTERGRRWKRKKEESYLWWTDPTNPSRP
jgi:hypothetical protein